MIFRVNKKVADLVYYKVLSFPPTLDVCIEVYIVVKVEVRVGFIVSIADQREYRILIKRIYYSWVFFRVK